MQDRKLNVSTGANMLVALKRVRFDNHLNECADCNPGLCHLAQSLWRSVCLAALRTQGGAK